MEITDGIILLGVGLLLINMHSLRKIKQGIGAMDEERSWLPLHSFLCYIWWASVSVIVWMYSDIPIKEVSSTLFFIGGFIWVVNMTLYAFIANIILEPFYDYKKNSQVFGFDLKDHVGKWVVRIEQNPYLSVPENQQVSIMKIAETGNVLGTFPCLVSKETIGYLSLNDSKEKDKIEKLVTNWKESNNIYLVVGDDLEKSSQDIEVIMI